jgi:hypothetical protein
MAYVSADLRKVLDLGGEVGGAMWVLDTPDAVATVYAAGYISDALTKGMRKGDIVLHRRWTTTVPVADSELKTAAGVANILLGLTWMGVIGISTAGAADLTDGTAIAVTNT